MNGAEPSGSRRPNRMGAGSIHVLASAKINLGLEVLGRRPDGYHEIATLLQTVRLTDRIELRLQEEPGIRLRVEPSLDLGPPESNLAVKAARLIPPNPGDPNGLAIRLVKRIPVGAGLGGGSADAAAVLVGLNRLRGRGLSVRELEELGSRLGSDVPFLVQGGTRLGVGRGERLLPAPRCPWRRFVLVFPNHSLSTRSIYARVNFKLTPPGPLRSIVYRGFSSDFWTEHGQDLQNDLEPAVIDAEPVIADILIGLRRMGSAFVRVTGSGSAAFGVAPDRETARDWVATFRMAGLWSRSVGPAREGCTFRD